MLEHLERANLFIIPLDGERRWYRYHQLFAEFLRSRLRTTYAERRAEIHRQAALWHERNGLIGEAIDHALAAADHTCAARLIEQHAERMLTSGEGSAVRGWLQALPAAALRVRPRLSVAYAWAMLATSRFAEVEPYLLSGVLLEWEDRGAAATQVTQGIELCQQWGHLQHVVDGYYSLAQLQLAQDNCLVQDRRAE